MPQTAEFKLSDREFERLRSLVREFTAIELSDQKRELVHSRFSRRLRALGLASFGEYCDLVEGGGAPEVAAFASAITTNFTRFFREIHHFEFLKKLVSSPQSGRRLRIWSAGCSTGEEPYSIATSLLDVIPDIGNRDIRILATDIDGHALKTASEGIYPLDRVADIEHDLLKRWFRRGRGRFEHHARVCDAARRLISFRSLNLATSWSLSGPFDVIFCRNVVIYFSLQTKVSLISRFAALQQPGAHLIMGHAENLAGVSNLYEPIGKTIYRRLPD